MSANGEWNALSLAQLAVEMFGVAEVQKSPKEKLRQAADLLAVAKSVCDESLIAEVFARELSEQRHRADVAAADPIAPWRKFIKTPGLIYARAEDRTKLLVDFLAKFHPNADAERVNQILQKWRKEGVPTSMIPELVQFRASRTSERNARAGKASAIARK